MASLEQQHIELQRKLHAIESTNRLTVEECERMIADQAASVRKLTAENRTLQAQLAQEGRNNNGGASSSHEYRAIKLRDLADAYRRKLEIQNRQMLQIDIEADVSRARLLEARIAVGSASTAEAAERESGSHVAALAARLETLVSESNAALAAVADLRSRAEALHTKRCSFQHCQAQLSADLAARNKQLSELNAAIRAANEERQKAVAAASGLRADAAQRAAAAAATTAAVAAGLKLQSAPPGEAESALDALRALAGLPDGADASAVVALFVNLAGDNAKAEAEAAAAGTQAASLAAQSAAVAAEVEALEGSLLTPAQRERVRAVLARRDEALAAASRYEEQYHATADVLDSVVEEASNALYALAARQAAPGSRTINERVLERLALLENYARAIAAVCKKTLAQ